MTHLKLENHIQKKLADLDRQQDMQDAVHKGRFSFGLDQRTYGHLPAWNDVVQQRKKMIRVAWGLAFFVSLAVTGMASGFGERFSGNWVKTILLLFVVSAAATIFYVMGSFYSLFIEFRKTEREVRKLIYQDILFQLKREKDAV